MNTLGTLIIYPEREGVVGFWLCLNEIIPISP